MTPIEQVITPLPDAPNPASDSPGQFSTKAAAMVLATKSMVPELNTMIGQMNVLAEEMSAPGNSPAALQEALAAPTGAAQVGAMAQGAGAIPTDVQTVLRETISASRYSTLQDALNAAAGKKLLIPPGTGPYLVTDELEVPSNIEIDLGGNTIRQAAGAKTENGLFFISGKTGVKIYNGTIDVNVANQGYVMAKTDAGRGIFAYNSSDIQISVKFVNPYGSMVLAANCSKVIVYQSDLDDQGGTGTNAVVFNTCIACDVVRCAGTGKAGVTGYGVFATGSCSFIRAIGNSFKYWQIVMSGADYVTAGTSSGMLYCRIDDNTLIEPSADTSIHFGLYGSVCRNVIMNSRDVGISMDYSRNTVINDNVIRTSNASGIAGPGCIDCTFDGNMISDPGSEWVSVVTNGQRCGIWLPPADDGSPPFVYPSGNTVSNNTIRDALGVKKMYFGISIADDSGNNINFVKGNYIAGAVAANYDMPSQTNVGEFEAIKVPALLNGWLAYGSGYSGPAYYKTEEGTVFLKGLIKSGATGTVIFTLPVGYRPVSQLMVAVLTDTGVGRLDVFPSGDLMLVTGGTGFVSLSGMTFPCR